MNPDGLVLELVVSWELFQPKIRALPMRPIQFYYFLHKTAVEWLTDVSSVFGWGQQIKRRGYHQQKPKNDLVNCQLAAEGIYHKLGTRHHIYPAGDSHNDFFLRMEVFLRLRALFIAEIAERRAQSRHMNHSRRGIVRRWNVYTIQQRDTVRNCTKRSRSLRPPRAVAALAHELGATFLCWKNRRGGSNVCLTIVRPALYRKR